MASGATVKLGVEGISQFKNNMNQAKQAVKTLDAQLTLTEKQFKQSGDAESYMAEKTELLKAKLEQQRSVVNNAQKALDDMTSRGVDRASKAYQDMYRQMITAKGALIDTENQLNGVADAGDKVSDGVSEMNAQLKRVGDGVNFQQVTTGIDKITGGLKNAATKAINLAKRIADAMIEAGSYADDLNTRAANYGISTDRLQRMEKTSRLIDTSVDAIINSQKKLKKGLGSENKEVMGSIAELLGVGYNLSGKGWEDVFWDAGEALMKFANEEQQEVYAQRLFGRSWAELIPLFQAGREEYEKTNESWKVVSQESIDNLQKMQDEYDKLMENWEAFKVEALAQFAEPMQTAFEAAETALGKFMEYLKSEEGQAMVDNVVNGLKSAIEWISDPENIQKAIDALKTVVTGWALLTVGKEAMTVMNFLNGIKGLAGKGADKVTGGGGAAVAASGGGGLLTGTAAGAKLAGLMSGAQIISSVNGGPYLDWFLNQTNAGRELRDGGGFKGLWTGLKQDVSEKIEEIKHNADTFEEDWKNNVFVKFFTDRNDNADAATRLAIGADWRPSYMQGTDNNYYNPNMVQAIDDLTGATDAGKKANDDMKDAADNMQKLPAEVAQAIRDQMNGMVIEMDGESVGTVLLPYLDYRMAQYILNK